MADLARYLHACLHREASTSSERHTAPAACMHVPHSSVHACIAQQRACMYRTAACMHVSHSSVHACTAQQRACMYHTAACMHVSHTARQRACMYRTGAQVKSTQARSTQAKSSQVKPSQAKSSQVKSSRLKLGRLKSSQVKSRVRGSGRMAPNPGLELYTPPPLSTFGFAVVIGCPRGPARVVC